MQYVQLSPDTTKVITVFAGPQATTSDKSGYATIADTDARFVAFQAVQAALAAVAAALVAGIAITSTGMPALNATYALDAASQMKLIAEQVYIATTGKFTNGGTTRSWQDASGEYHTFTTTAGFTAFAEAVAAYVDALAAALQTVKGGGLWTAPSATATIA